MMTLGIDLGGTNVRAGMNENGTIVSHRQIMLKDKDSLEGTLAQIFELVSSLIKPGVKGIGVGVPSVVDIENGIVYNAINIPSWEKVELKAILEKEFHVPVFVNNDVNCFILGEHRYGLAKAFSSVVGITIGTGLGSGIIINNELYPGSNCGAGEIGYLPYLDKNFEYYCASAFFETDHKTTALKTYLDATKGKAEALEIWAQFGKHMGNALKAIIYAYDPEAIVIGGAISKSYEFFQSAMKESMKDLLFPESLKRIQIFQSTNESISLLGTTALVK